MNSVSGIVQMCILWDHTNYEGCIEIVTDVSDWWKSFERIFRVLSTFISWSIYKLYHVVVMRGHALSRV